LNRPSKEILRKTADQLQVWRMRCRTETVHLDKRMEILMGAIANLCIALTEEELEVVDVEVLPDREEGVA